MDATVNFCNQYTKNLWEITKEADIIVSATGIPNLITGDMLKKGSVVFDVGISWDENTQKVIGDIDI